MRAKFTIIAILLVFLTFPMMSAPKPKYKSLWLSGCACYEGYTIKKAPEGDGVLTIYYPKDINRKDIIKGTFKDGKVIDATLSLNDNKVVYVGTISYVINPDSASYTIYEGELNGFSFKDSLTIHRNYSDFKTNRIVLQRNQKTKSKSSSEETALFSHLSYLIEEGHEPSMNILYRLELTTDGYFIQKSTPDDMWSLGGGRYLKRTQYGFRRTAYELIHSNSDSLYVTIYNNNGGYLDLAGGDNMVKRVFENGTVFYSEENRIHWDDYCSDVDKNKIDLLPYDRHLPKGAVKDDECCQYTITIEYVDGTVFRGWIKSNERNACKMILMLSKLPDKADIGYGVIDYPDGSSVTYMNGMLLDEVIEYDNTVRNQEEAEAQRAKAEKELKYQQYKQQFYKYGKKYVDTLFDSNGHKMLVGTPLELLQKYEHCDLDLDIDHGDSKCYDWYWEDAFVRIKQGYIWVRNGKVTSVVYL